MFRLFRRRGKEKSDVKEKEEKPIDEPISPPVASQDNETLESEPETSELVEVTPEIPFEEKFEGIIKLPPEYLIEEKKSPLGLLSPPLYIESIIYNDIDSYLDFISPELFMELSKEQEAEYTLVPKKVLPPITLEEKIEGALFSIGRPIHADELIEFLQEESPIVKRAIRKASRQRKKSSPIVIEEISKDRWVLQLNPLYHEFFELQVPKLFLGEDIRRILTEIAYRQPISLGLVKKIVKGIGPLRINEICKELEEREYIIGESRARSIVYTTTPKFAHDFGFDNESRRLKLQMLWRLRRLMGDWDTEEEEEEEEEEQEATTAVEEEEEEESEGDVPDEIETEELTPTEKEIELTPTVAEVIPEDEDSSFEEGRAFITEKKEEFIQSTDEVEDVKTQPDSQEEDQNLFQDNLAENSDQSINEVEFEDEE